MANKKISELPVATTIADADLHVIVQGGVTKAITHLNVQDTYLLSANDLSDVADAATARANLDVMSTAEVAAEIGNFFGEVSHTPSVFFNDAATGSPAIKVWKTGYQQRQIGFIGVLDCSAMTLSSSTFTLAFTLPAGWRPATALYFPVVGFYSAIGVISVLTNGEVHLKQLAGDLQDSGVVAMNSVSFYLHP